MRHSRAYEDAMKRFPAQKPVKAWLEYKGSAVAARGAAIAPPAPATRPAATSPNIGAVRFAGPSGASFSRCRKWRYLLWRRWSEGPVANFLMLNPSTADEAQLDPSCTRARNYAARWRYGALVVTNLFG